MRLTANMREDIHLKLKIAAARQRTTIGEILEELVEKYIK
ncbi:plasmid partition protein ParG [Geobacter anodireducens]